MELQQTISARPSPIQPVGVEAPEVTWVAKKLCDKYGERMVLSVARWYLQGIHSVTEPATWISFYQLYGRVVHFIVMTGQTHVTARGAV